MGKKVSSTGMQSILVIQTAFLGDIVLTSSFLRELRMLCPDARITLLTTPVGASVLQPNPWNIDFLIYDKKGKERGFGALMQKLGEVRARKPDLVFCLHRSIRSGVIARWSGAGEVWGFAEAAGKLFYTKRVRRADRLYEGEKNLLMLEEKFGKIRGDLSPYPELFCTNEERARASSLLGAGDYAVIAPSSVWATKRWPAERFGHLAARIVKECGLRVALVAGGGEEEHEVVHSVRVAYEVAGGTPEKLLDLSGKTSLGELKAVLAGAKFLVGNDSAPLHIAISMGRPGVAVFGPTVREQGFFPLAKENSWDVVELSGLNCRPCGEHGHNRCPEEHFRCMLELPVEKVFDRVKRLCQAR